jgi:hypothetical protein
MSRRRDVYDDVSKSELSFLLHEALRNITLSIIDLGALGQRAASGRSLFLFPDMSLKVCDDR